MQYIGSDYSPKSVLIKFLTFLNGFIMMAESVHLFFFTLRLLSSLQTVIMIYIWPPESSAL